MKKDHKLAIIKYDEIEKNTIKYLKTYENSSLISKYAADLKRRHPLAVVTVRKTTNADTTTVQLYDYIATDGSEDTFYNNELIIVG